VKRHDQRDKTYGEGGAVRRQASVPSTWIRPPRSQRASWQSVNLVKNVLDSGSVGCRDLGTMPYRPEKRVVSDKQFILIVDHLRIQRTALRYLLQDEYRLAFAESAQEAIELVKAHRPDLIVMDHLLPYLDGWEATRAIRRQGYTGPIIVTTAFPTPEDFQKANQFGALDYVIRPLDIFEFQTLVRRRTQEQVDPPLAERTAKGCG